MRYGWNSSGPYTVRTWQGTRAAIATQYATVLTTTAVAEVRQGIGCDTLEATYSEASSGGGNPATDITDNWEFSAGVVEKDLLEADISVINNLTAAELTALRHVITNPPQTPAEEPALGAGANSVYLLIRNGVRSVRTNAPKLRHTLTVGSAYAVKASMAKVGLILTTTTLQNDEMLPGDILFSLPSLTYGGTRALVYGWFKMHPTIRVAARQKTQIEQEWEYGLWSTVLYGSAV